MCVSHFLSGWAEIISLNFVFNTKMVFPKRSNSEVRHSSAPSVGVCPFLSEKPRKAAGHGSAGASRGGSARSGSADLGFECLSQALGKLFYTNSWFPDSRQKDVEKQR